VPPDPATLSAIARLTGGKFFAARTADALESAYADLGSKLGRVPGRVEITWWLLAAAAALVVVAGVLSALWSPRLP
jgi:Ca-activated chloride channel homolog